MVVGEQQEAQVVDLLASFVRHAPLHTCSSGTKSDSDPVKCGIEKVRRICVNLPQSSISRDVFLRYLVPQPEFA